MDEEYRRFLEKLWHPRRDQVIERILEAARQPSHVLHAQLLDAGASDDPFRALVGCLAEAIRHRRRGVRRVAAVLLAEAFSVLQATAFALNSFVPDELQQAMPALIGAAADPDAEVRANVLTALGHLAPCAGPRVIPVLTERFFADPDPVVVARSLALVMSAGADAASVAIPSITKLLEHRDADVRRQACAALVEFRGEIDASATVIPALNQQLDHPEAAVREETYLALRRCGSEAGAVVPRLIELARSEDDHARRRLAVQAIVAIDVDGRLTSVELNDRQDREGFLTLLRHIGPEARPLRLRVERHRDCERQLTSEADGSTRSPVHSDDFRSVNWFGTSYSFTAEQAACVRILWEHWERGTPEVGHKYLLTEAESAGDRLDVVFRNHPAWGSMIVPGNTKGTRRLAPPEQTEPVREK